MHAGGVFNAFCKLSLWISGCIARRHLARRNGLPAGASFGNVLFRKMIPDTFPLQIAQPNHSPFIAHRHQAAILR